MMNVTLKIVVPKQSGQAGSLKPRPRNDVQGGSGSAGIPPPTPSKGGHGQCE